MLESALRAVLDEITWELEGFALAESYDESTGTYGGLASPADEPDLAYFLRQLPREVPAVVIGLGSNLLVRDGGVPGVVVRLGRGFLGPRLCFRKRSSGTRRAIACSRRPNSAAGRA